MADAVVVGLGQVGSRNDEGRNRAVPLSHVGAILAAPELRLVAMVDSDPKARIAAEAQWRNATDAAILAGMSELKPGAVDLVALCTPTASRRADVAAALALRPKLLIVEKPLASDLTTARRLHRAAVTSGVGLRVNFNRRFDPATRAFRDWFDGVPARAVLQYGRGLYNYASHMVDLLLDWFGPITSVQAVGKPGPGDRSPSFCCRLAAGFEALFVGAEGLDYDRFEIDLQFTDRRLEYAAGGALRRMWRPHQDHFYAGYAHLPPEPERTETGQIGGFCELYVAVGEHLAYGSPLGGCDGETAVAGVAVLEAVSRSAAANGQPVRLRQPISGDSKKAR